MTDQERQRLAAILGMLGSAHAGERAAAALQAEAFRKKHGLTWTELLAAQSEHAPSPPEPEPPPPTPPAPPPPQPFRPSASPQAHTSAIDWEFGRSALIWTLAGIIGFFVVLNLIFH